MKKIVSSIFVISLSSITCVFATPILSDNFDSYTDGALVGQGTWAQTGSTATSAVQVNSGVVTIGNTGQDIYDPFSSPVVLSDGQSLYFGLSINVSAAQSGGDYFMHFTPSAGNSSLFYDRLFIQSTTGGYLLGLEGTSGGGATVSYGSSVLSLNSSYNIVLAYNCHRADQNRPVESDSKPATLKQWIHIISGFSNKGFSLRVKTSRTG